MARWFSSGACFGLLAFVACGLDVSGTADGVGAVTDDAGLLSDGSGGDAFGIGDVAALDGTTPGDGGVPTDGGAIDGAPTDGPPGTCTPNGTVSCFGLPMGWNVVAYVPTSQPACPSAFMASHSDLVEGPQPGAGACTCDACQMLVPPSCQNGAIGLHYDLDSFHLCLIPAASLANSPGGSCGQDQYAGQYYASTDFRFTPPPPTGGSCTSNAAKHGDMFSYAARGRTCSAASSAAAGCTSGVCSPPAPAAPYQICIAATGAQNCPGAPFGVKHVVGTDVTFDCGNGTCACGVAAQCSGTVTFYTDQNCMDNALPVPVDDSCHGSGGSGSAYGSYHYRAAASNVRCNETAPAASNVQLVNATTICCAQ